MRRALQLGLVVAFALAFAPAYGQLVDVFCPGPGGPEPKCTDDNLSIKFDVSGTNELVLDGFVADMAIPCKVFMDTMTAGSVQGWSFAVAHDPIDPVGVFGEPVVAVFVADEEKNQQACRQPNSQAGDVDERVAFVPTDVAEGDDNVVF